MASELSALIQKQLDEVDCKAGGARLKPVDVEVGPTAVAARSASRRRTAVACGVTIAAVVITALLLARHFAGPLGVPVGGGAKARDERGTIEAAKAASWNHVGPGPSETPAPATHAAVAEAAAHHDPTAAVHHDAAAAAAAAEHAEHGTAPETHHEPAAAAETQHEAAATEHHTAHETPAAEHHTHTTGETHAHEGGAAPHTHDDAAAAAAAAAGHEHATAGGHAHPATVTHGPGHDTDMPADADTP